MSTTEYAKLLTSYVNDATNQSSIYGLRTVVTLPSITEISVNKASNGNGFFDVYLSLDHGTHHYECGLSQDFGDATYWGLYKTAGGNKWHWFWTDQGVGSGGGSYTYTPGQTLPIEMSINANGGMDFIVNYQTVKTFTDATGPITNAHLVIGACDQNFVTVPDPLPTWTTYSNQIVCDHYAYLDSVGGTWHLIDPTSHINQVFWPEGDHPHVGEPQNWDFVTSNGNLTVLLKNPAGMP